MSQSEPTRDGDSQEYSDNCEREEFTTSLWKKNLVTMCKSYSREGTESLVMIGTAVLEIYRKKLKGGGKNMPPPPGRLRCAN